MLSRKLTAEKRPQTAADGESQNIHDEPDDPDDPVAQPDLQSTPSAEGATSTPAVDNDPRTPGRERTSSPVQSAFTTTPRKRVKVAFATDMQYSTRFNGKRYDSLSGQSTIIGVKSKKLCGYKVMTRKCFRCESGTPHVCMGVYEGTSRGMEPQATVDLLVKNRHLDEAGVVVVAYAGDDDASSVCAIKKASDHHIQKWSDHNHTKKALSRALWKISGAFRKFDIKMINYFLSCYGAAVKQNVKKVEATRKAILNIVPHAFGTHTNCGDWCEYLKDPEAYKHKHFDVTNNLVNESDGNNLSNSGLHSALTRLFEGYAAKAEAIAPGGSSQKCEAANNVFCSKSSKRTFTGGTMRHFYKISGGVCQINEGTQYAGKVFEKLNMSPSRRGLKYRMKKDVWRSQVAQIKLRKATKARRRALLKLRNNMKDKYQRTEGVVYESNMVFHQPAQEDVRCGGEVIPITDLPMPAVADIKFVYFDTETNGFGQIIQISAKLEGKEGKTFSAYAYPMNGISAQANKTNRLSLEGGELCYNGKPVESASLINCLRRFLEYLKSLGGPVVLVAHNAEFDLRHAIDSFADYFLLPEFASVVVGATDTVPIMKENPTVLHDVEEILKQGLNTDGVVTNVRKGRANVRTVQRPDSTKFIPIVSQSVLATRYIPNFRGGDAHEALYDCIILEDLCTALDVCRETLAARTKPLSAFVNRRVELLNKKKFAPGLAAMIVPKVISTQTVNKLAEMAFTIPKLAEKLQADGEKDFASFLKKEIINKAASVNAIIDIVKRMS